MLDPQARSDVGRVGKLQLRAADGRLLRLADVADIELTSGRYKILHAGGRRIADRDRQTSKGRDIARFRARVRARASRGECASRRATTWCSLAKPRRRRRRARTLIVHSPHRRHRHFPAAVHRVQQPAQSGHHVRQSSVCADRRRDRGRSPAAAGCLSVRWWDSSRCSASRCATRSCWYRTTSTSWRSTDAMERANGAARRRGTAALDPDDRAGHRRSRCCPWRWAAASRDARSKVRWRPSSWAA